jgi:hypothetical protein
MFCTLQGYPVVTRGRLVDFEICSVMDGVHCRSSYSLPMMNAPLATNALLLDGAKITGSGPWRFKVCSDLRDGPLAWASNEFTVSPLKTLPLKHRNVFTTLLLYRSPLPLLPFHGWYDY